MTDIDLTQGSILGHIRRIAIPSSIGFLFNTLFNVVDTYYAGKLSTDALAGMTISFPIFFIVIALSSGVGSGTTALSAIALGKKDEKHFHDLAYNALAISLILSVLIVIIAPAITSFLFKISGASGEAMRLGIDYTKVIFYGAVFFILNSVLNGLLNAQGDTKSNRNFLIVGFFMNLLLDPLFIFGWFCLPRMGVIGVGLATVIVQFFGTIYLIYRLYKSPIFKWHDFRSSKMSRKTLHQLIKQGVPASLNMVTVAIGVFVINYFVLLYTDATTIAAYGAAMRVEQLALLPAFGLNIAALTMTGQNFGAKNMARIYEVKKIALSIGVGIMVIGGLIIYPLAPFLIGLFNSDPGVIQAGTYYLRIEAFAFPTYVILNMILSVLQGVKRPNFAIFIGLYRQIVIPVVLFTFLGTVLKLGITGIWWGIVLINWSAVMIAMVYSKRQLGQVEAELLGDGSSASF